MSKNKIVIVGGGSAGWMTAAAMIRYFPNKQITLVESANIPTIGVGESTTAAMRHFIRSHLKIEDVDFMPGADAIFKLSVKFNDFYHLNDGGFHYPFGKPLLENLGNSGIEAWDIVKYYNKDLPKDDFTQSYFPAYELFTNNKVSENKNGEFGNFNFLTDVGYHLDANKLGVFLRDKYCIPRGVTNTIGEVSNVNLNSKGFVQSLELSDGSIIEGDLFIDCTGFRSVLLGKTMQSKFIDLSHKLPNNRAWATPIQYKDVYKEMTPFTTSTALKNGWAWYTPIASRIGNGYAYCDKFTTPEAALDEFKEYLASDKVPIKLSKEEIDKLPFFEIKMQAGYRQEAWIKNVVGIGLSQGFLEPLEGTGLFFIIESILQLVKLLGRKDVNQLMIDAYNLNMKGMSESWADILSVLYAQTIREDSDYWFDIKYKKFELDLLDIDKLTSYVSFKTNLSRITHDHSSQWTNYDAYTAFAHGCDFTFDVDDQIMDRWSLWDNKLVNYKELSKQFKSVFEQRKHKWSAESRKEMHVYDYMKKNNLIRKDIK